jgi:sugar/nucleoside kinase (ribokinase family)
MYDLITVGNISIDLYFSGQSLTHSKDRFQLAIGGKYTADAFHESIGGGAANVAIGVQKAGLHTAIVAKIGETRFKPILLDMLKKHGVSARLCHTHETYVKISTILLAPSGERTIVNYETPHEHIIRHEADLEQFENTKAIYLSNLPFVPLEERKKILSHAHAKKIKTIVNLGTKDCRRPTEQIIRLLHHADIVILNAHEFAELAKSEYEHIDLAVSIQRRMPEFAHKLVVITDGKKGSFAYQNGSVLHQPALPAEKIIDTTGAGDGFTAGFIAELLKTNDVGKALHAGAHYAVKIIQKIGAN